MKTIIVSTDFSSAALNATHYAASLAIQVKASILLLHVYQLPVSISEEPPVLISLDELKDAMETKLNGLKKDLEHVLSNKIPVEISAQPGTVPEALEEICERVQPFAIVMGTTGHSAIDRILFGSTILSAIRHINWPVIGVPQGKDYGHGIKKAGLVIDLSEFPDDLPLAPIRNFIQEMKAQLHVLNMGSDTRKNGTVLLETSFAGIPLHFSSNAHSDLDENISAFVEQNNLDILISILKTHRLFEGLFRKNTTRKLLSHSHVPVMGLHH